MGNVVILDKLTYAGCETTLNDVVHNKRLTVIRDDIANASEVMNILKAGRINTVVNFAAESHVDRSIDSPEPFFQTNVMGTLQLLEACRHHWSNQPASDAEKFKFVHVSTDEVYGSLDSTEAAPFTEDSAFAPNSPYAASKAASDHLVRSYGKTYKLPIITTHCSNNYGPNQFPEKLIPLMIIKTIKQETLPIYGDGQNIRDWIYVKDHCDALWQVINKGTLGETYNIGANAEVTNLQVVQKICDYMDFILPLPNQQSYHNLISFVKDRPGHDRRYAVNSKKVRKTTGWYPKVHFDHGLSETIQWYLNNSQWWLQILERKYSGHRLGVAA